MGNLGFAFQGKAAHIVLHDAIGIRDPPVRSRLDAHDARWRAIVCDSSLATEHRKLKTHAMGRKQTSLI
jgi:hypothetical protein